MSEMPDLDGLLRQAMELQQQLVAAQAEAEATLVEGAAGGGSVRITMRGSGEVVRVRIDPAAVDPAEVDLLEDLVLAALHDAARQAEEVRTGAVGGPGAIPGLGDLGSLGGLLGGPSDP